MSRDGGTTLARFAQALARKDGLTFGTPWLSHDGSTAVLPILGTAPRPRRWVLAAEASDRISAVDSGRLDRLCARNDAPFAVFLPPGSLFRSDATASRSTVAGIVMGPRSEASIEVKCVHASRALSPGVVLTLDPRLAPAEVCRSLLSRDQGRVWSAVADFVGKAQDRSSAGSDLVAALPDSGAAAPGPNGIPATPPIPPGQCGVVILDASGISAVEWYENPEDWKVAVGSGLERFARSSQATVAPPWTVTLDASAAVPAAREFLSQLAGLPLRRVAPSSWVSEDFSVGCTALEGNLIHLIAFGRRAPVDRQGVGSGVPASSEGFVGVLDAAAGTPAAPASGDADVAAAEVLAEGVPEYTDSAPAAVRPRRRKVLTSGWDDATFGTLERYAYKEFRGDRSAAMRFLVRQGLRTRGYFGPMPSRPPSEAGVAVPDAEAPSPQGERARAGLEARLEDLERIAATPQYATWLRKRARLELERIASTLEDDLLRTSARSALDRLASVEPEPEPVVPELPRPEPYEPIEIEVPPLPPSPPKDLRPLLRQAFAASAGGDYRQAVGLFDQILAADPANRTARLGRAVALRRAGKPQEALADLDIVLRAEPRNAAALLARGQILQARGDLDGALASFDLLVDVAASDWDVWAARGDVLAKMGRNEDALRSYGEALRRNPEDQSLQARIRTLEVARVPAAPTTLPRAARPPGIEEGQSYLVQEVRRERSLAVFRALAGRRIPSLILTGRPRDQVHREVGVLGVRIVGLSYLPGEDVHHPTALASLTRTIERFVEDNQGRGVIWLDGLGDLVTGNGFRDAILFIERIHETILQSQAVLLISVTSGGLTEKEMALLERNLKVLT